jgi:hypothetical protein
MYISPNFLIVVAALILVYGAVQVTRALKRSSD